MADSKGVPRPGDVIADKYRVEREIGSGGMGTVYEVTHLVTHRRFAIKWLDPALATSAEATQRFIREAQIAGSFDHPHVVEVYDLGVTDGSYFMLMELLEGESLAARLARQVRLSVRDTLDIMLPCLKAVAAAHAAGIVHRDLKPANIFLCQATSHTPETVKVLDFGISKLVANSSTVDPMRTKTGAIMGTPHYMAPEQMRGQRIDLRVDIYALGVTLYEVLSGQRPFDANSYPELVLKIVGDPITPLNRLVPNLPRGLSSVVARTMARDPADRYSSVGALMSALAPFRNAADGSAQFVESVHPSRFVEPGPPPRPQLRTPLFSESIAEGKTVSTAAGATWPWWSAAAAALVLAGLGVLWERRGTAEHGQESSVSAAAAAEPDAPNGLSRERARQIVVNPGSAESPPESQSLIGAPLVDPAKTAAADGIVAEPSIVPGLSTATVPLVMPAGPAANGPLALRAPDPGAPAPHSPAVTAAVPYPAPMPAPLPPVAAPPEPEPEPATLAQASLEDETAAPKADADETPQQVLDELRKLAPEDSSSDPARARPRPRPRPRMDTSEF